MGKLMTYHHESVIESNAHFMTSGYTFKIKLS